MGEAFNVFGIQAIGEDGKVVATAGSATASKMYPKALHDLEMQEWAERYNLLRESANARIDFLTVEGTKHWHSANELYRLLEEANCRIEELEATSNGKGN